MTRLHYLQHVTFEGPSKIADWAEAQGMTIEGTLVSTSPLPKLDDFDWLLVMGGPMGVYDEDELPWLAAEKAFIAQAITAGKVVIGICLGAQLIAASMGARVYPNGQKEIGWMDVQSTEAGRDLFGLPESFTVFQWHGDTFELPEGATLLASSPVAKHQAFLYDNRVLALQFHLESSDESVALLCEHCADELVDGPTIQTADEMRSNRLALSESNDSLILLMDRFIKKQS